MPVADSTRRRLHEQAEATKAAIDTLIERKARLLSQVRAVEAQLLHHQRDLENVIEELYGVRARRRDAAGSSRDEVVESALPTAAEAAAEPDGEVTVVQPTTVVEDGPDPRSADGTQPSDPLTAADSEAEVDDLRPPHGIFEVPVDEWTDLQLAWMVMNPTMLKTYTVVCSIRRAIDARGGSAKSGDILAELQDRGFAMYDHQLADALRTPGYFSRSPDNLWRAVTTGPILTPKRRAIAARWLIVIKIILRRGGMARWSEIFSAYCVEVGATATKNQLNHVLRDGPFGRGAGDRWLFEPKRLSYSSREQE